ncbi:MAG: type II toxin-antitoxin system RelE/ParE family toxin [Bacteroidota bacterium]|nr:type II toxin-antitoxin system RelE/ParE family toxin [Bacteroidota bacterium]
MSYTLTLRPLALQDISEIIKWYNDKQSGLGNKFLAALREAGDSIILNPLGYELKFKKKFRQCKIKGFPYLIHFIVENEE